MSLRRFIPFLSLLLLASCATPAPMRWERAGGTAEAFRTDRYACVRESRTSWSAGGTGIYGAILMAQAKASAQQEAQRLFGLCMEARGYTGHPVVDTHIAP